MLTVEQVEARVARIERMAGDDEAAHSAEDKLHAEVLAAIAAGHKAPQALAAAAARTASFDFQRWCA